MVRSGFLGAKSGNGVYQAIVNLMPPHDTYIEAFLGTGAIMHRKAPAIRTIGLDLDKKCLDSCNFPDAELYQENAMQWLKHFDFSSAGRTVVYCDPPYLPETRTSNAKYQFEMTIDDHIRLLDILTELPCHIMLSGYQSDLYDEKLAGWNKSTFQAMSRGGVRTEVVWYNFDPKEMHYHSYAGTNFAERQRIKRKAKRWASNFEKLPPAERQAILAAILATN
jgi:DNA adenine methylase